MSWHHSQADPLLRGPAPTAPLGERDNLVNRPGHLLFWKLISRNGISPPQALPALGPTAAPRAAQGWALSTHPSCGLAALEPRSPSLMASGLRKRDTAASQTVSYTQKTKTGI